MNMSFHPVVSAEPTKVDSELVLFRDSIQRFLDREVTPYYASWERAGIIPRSLWKTLGEAGLLCVDTPVEYGGHGAPFSYSCAILEEIGRRGFGGLVGSIAVHSDIVSQYVGQLGTEAQKCHYLPKLACGEFVGAIAMTEPGAGSDLQGIKTSAVLSDDRYLINGSKTFITNGQHADLVITVAVTDSSGGSRNKTLFLVDASTEGFYRGRNLEKIGQHCADTSEIFYSDVSVPRSAILGQLANGFVHLVDGLARERLVLAVGAVAAADGAIAATIDYVRNRKAFGQSLSAFQNTRYELAQMKTDTELVKAFIAQCTRLYAANMLDAPTAAMCKLASSENQFRVADRCLQLFGGYGYMVEYPISRHFVDARVQRIYGGTSEIMKEVIARSILGR
jgi:acyl-CoA dehydrogenase